MTYKKLCEKCAVAQGEGVAWLPGGSRIIYHGPEFRLPYTLIDQNNNTVECFHSPMQIAYICD